MPDTTEPSEPVVPPNPVIPPTNAGRGGYNGSPNPNALPPTASVPSPNPNVLSPDHPSFGGRGGYNVSPGSSSPVPAQTIPYPPPNTHLEQPQPIHPTFGGRGGYHTSPQSQSPVPTFAIGKHSPLSDNEHGGFGGRGGYHTSQGPEPAPMPSHPAQTFAEYEAEHGHGASSRKGSIQEGPEPGFGGRGGYNAATRPEAPPAPGSLRHTPTFAEYEAEHGHASLSRKGSVQAGPDPGFGGRGGYHATGGPEQPVAAPHRAATFAEYEQEHGHGTEVRKKSVSTPEHGFGGRGGYNASTAGTLSPEGPFGAPHRAQTFSEYEQEHGHGTEVRKKSVSTPEHGFGGRGGYNANPPAALSPEGPFGAPHRAQTFADYEAEHLGAGVRKLSLQEGPEHGFGGRGGHHASSGTASPSEPPLFAAPHRAPTFADYEAERGHGSESRKGSVALSGPEQDRERRGSVRPREEEGDDEDEDEDERMEFGGRGAEGRPPVPEVEVHDHERAFPGLDGPGHPGFGGRGGYNGQR